ncbi:transcription termination factor MTERF15, mitochondrial [Rhodamnia argentea]|uniref:Transcription termination factor MTERF15, mitochondrial n=1 Tax=Rhodamnia argentea TaxID=178133 RepID=A0A8B8PL10_9MYRT|nr:transcription termination factor MTERF15, mitochondrial [Rhodamnia argentea]XP_048135840.1 transcription termination factor MTERF15, mitochondrial [Rhodamnia argentea]XP_048135841.1 transcription termination factor MTERF15, mitochondrial [Rhodamnia argentea]XP_048135842.1 transcription termination factor MTERF15, mitochondrial [Rhodamnia argentea]XP_048135843.1 transcription termination factor MTERF15, mitochondrial [Rhodamnia argentea]XP_048135844.1 transcription termination factor MTERF15
MRSRLRLLAFRETGRRYLSGRTGDSSSPNPRFLSQSQHRKQVSLANLFQRYGFSPSQSPDFLAKNRFLLDASLHDTERSLSILSSLKIPNGLVISVMSQCPGVLEHDFLRRWEVVFREFGFLGVSSAGIISTLQVSRKFNVGPERFGTIFEVLKGLGVEDRTYCRILEEFPGVIALGESEILGKVKFLEGIGISKAAMDRVFCTFPGIMGLSVEDRLKPLMREFRHLGFDKGVARDEILREPRVLGMELGELSRCLELLRTLKCREPIKEKIFRGGEFRAGFEVKLRLDCLCRHGLIRRDAFKVLWKEPRLIVYQTGEIERKIDFLVNEMNYDVECLIEVPEYLGVNFEKQILPRYNVIEYLRSIGGLGDPVGLTNLIKPSRLKFYNLYVKPYPECEKIFRKCEGDEAKKQHAVGLWKLFKPQKYPQSKDDAENIRSFMELGG